MFVLVLFALTVQIYEANLPADHPKIRYWEEKRLFRYPLSYMIYSDAFDALPESVRSTIYRRLRHELQASNAILEILRDTKPDFSEPTRH